ncbi:MAG: alpha/beta hydrolase [Firmicutes bacterium]|nr:alpha/beta hydrolase [Bacillota bacterium]
MPYIEINQTRYYYAGDIKRNGIPVVFCHGSGGGHHHWLLQLQGLREPVNPIAVDLPGHGRSEGKPMNTVADYRDWLHRFSKAAGIGSFVPAGHSLGGAIVLDYALHYPEDIKGLILIGTGGRLKVLPAILESLKKGSVPETFSDFLYSAEAPDELMQRGREEVLNTEPSLYYADLCACNEFDVMEMLHRISKPALIICGSNDQLTPVKYSRYMENSLPESCVEIIDKAGHMVMLEKPEELNRTITNFIECLLSNSQIN